MQAMRENTYVRVRGTVRSFAGKKSIVAFKISPITDMNEMTYHILEVIHSHASLAALQTNVSVTLWRALQGQIIYIIKWNVNMLVNSG